jgi:hypothetical protein
VLHVVVVGGLSITAASIRCISLGSFSMHNSAFLFAEAALTSWVHRDQMGLYAAYLETTVSPVITTKIAVCPSVCSWSVGWAGGHACTHTHHTHTLTHSHTHTVEF